MDVKRALTLAAAFVAAMAQSAATLADPDPDEPSGFEIAYGTSFMKYDACDDHEAGQIFRQAVRERFKRCHFIQAVNDKFEAWLVDTLEALATDGFRAAAEGMDITPRSHFPDGIKTCKEYRATPAYVEMRNLLLKYKRREVGLDAVIPDECTLGPAAL